MSEAVDLGRVAHGGFVVGRINDKVVFVHGGLPGEKVLVEITERSKSFDRGHVVEVIEPSEGRVVPPCPVADRCGGCDWQHASAELQLDMKTAVVAEQLSRLAGIVWEGRVVSVGSPLGWRTRMRYSVTPDNVVGLRARRSHDVVALPPQGCSVAVPGPSVTEMVVMSRGASELQVVQSADGVTVLADKSVVEGPRVVHEVVAGHRFAVDADGFWQVHPRAAEVLTQAVLKGLSPSPGESAMDLYCGVGLFAAPLVAAGCTVVGIEGSRSAISQARKNVPTAKFLVGSMDKHVRSFPDSSDVVVLDPPRKGAGAKVVEGIAAMNPRAVAYVACDPSALARDLATFSLHGYEVASVEAFDLFPMTHHVECVAVLVPQAPS